MMRRLHLLAGVMGILLLPYPSAGEESDTLPCDREMRKTIEAMQAFRRQNQGRYPDSLSDLTRHGYLQWRDAACPLNRQGDAQADERANFISSRRLGGDRSGRYEYELSDQVVLNDGSRMFLPADPPPFTRAQLKGELLRRAFSEQVPLLRCDQHRSGPSPASNPDDGRRNATAYGTIYWSGLYWEQVWIADVPGTSRDLNVFYGLEGPPFYVDRAPALDGAIDFRPWNSAFGDVAWWWELPFFDEGSNRQRTPDLGPFFHHQQGMTRDLGGTSWWLNGLVQVQGEFSEAPGLNRYHQPTSQDHPPSRLDLPIKRHFHAASWLQGTLWTGSPGEPVGFLIWHYEDGTIERVPILYGVHSARFWCDEEQSRDEQLVRNLVSPVWSEHQTREQVGVERQLRLYQQRWTNPHPDVQVTSLDFVAATNSPAAPFLVAMQVTP